MHGAIDKVVYSFLSADSRFPRSAYPVASHVQSRPLAIRTASQAQSIHVTENPLDTFFEVSGATSDGLSFYGTDTIDKVVP